MTATLTYQLFDRPTTPYSTSWQDWAAQWVKWCLEIPPPKHPAIDTTGAWWNTNQNDPDVYFLAGAFDYTPRPTVRNITMPGGKAILLPIAETDATFAEFPSPKANNYLDLTNIATGISSLLNVAASIDGIPLSHSTLDQYRVVSSPFTAVLPNPNVYSPSVPPGQTSGISDGTWIFLEPLARRNQPYVIKFTAQHGPAYGVKEFSIDVTINLTIV